MCLSRYLPISKPIYLCAYLNIYPYIYLSIHLSIYLAIHIFIYPSNYLSIWNLFFYLSIPLSIYLSIYLPIYLSTTHIVGKLLKSKVGLYGLEYLDKDQQNFDILPQNATYIGCACIERKGKSSYISIYLSISLYVNLSLFNFTLRIFFGINCKVSSHRVLFNVLLVKKLLCIKLLIYKDPNNVLFVKKE